MNLPISKIKRIAKFDPDVNLVSQEAAVALTFATESFIKTLSKTSFRQTQLNKRKTVQLKDIENALTLNSCFDFLDGVLETFVEEDVSHEEEDVNKSADEFNGSAADNGMEVVNDVICDKDLEEENDQEIKKQKTDDNEFVTVNIP